MTARHDVELRLAGIIILLMLLAYAGATVNWGVIPASRGLAGHLLGASGLFLMVMTETLYSLRKRASQPARWGQTQSWLRFHIFTGLVGPSMVLLHTSWRFNGLAGMVTLLTLLVTASGIVGRYIYTAVPRSADGLEIDSDILEDQIAVNETELGDWVAANAAAVGTSAQNVVRVPRMPHSSWGILFGRAFSRWNYRQQFWRASQYLRGVPQHQRKELYRLLDRHRELHYQAAALVLVRRVLSLWHAIHVPLGIALFTMAFMHVAVTLYYVTLAR